MEKHLLHTYVVYESDCLSNIKIAENLQGDNQIGIVNCKILKSEMMYKYKSLPLPLESSFFVEVCYYTLNLCYCRSYYFTNEQI